MSIADLKIYEKITTLVQITPCLSVNLNTLKRENISFRVQTSNDRNTKSITQKNRHIPPNTLTNRSFQDPVTISSKKCETG